MSPPPFGTALGPVHTSSFMRCWHSPIDATPRLLTKAEGVQGLAERFGFKAGCLASRLGLGSALSFALSHGVFCFFVCCFFICFIFGDTPQAVSLLGSLYNSKKRAAFTKTELHGASGLVGLAPSWAANSELAELSQRLCFLEFRLEDVCPLRKRTSDRSRSYVGTV